MSLIPNDYHRGYNDGLAESAASATEDAETLRIIADLLGLPTGEDEAQFIIRGVQNALQNADDACKRADAAAATPSPAVSEEQVERACVAFNYFLSRIGETPMPITTTERQQMRTALLAALGEG